MGKNLETKRKKSGKQEKKGAGERKSKEERKKREKGKRRVSTGGMRRFLGERKEKLRERNKRIWSTREREELKAVGQL